MLALPPEGSIIAVKEPYFKYNAPDDYMICVDHPSDAVYLKFDDPIIPKAFQSDDEETDTAADWKSAGDTSFIARNLPIAVYWFVNSLQVPQKKTSGISNPFLPSVIVNSFLRSIL
jgi:hypothetical protein